MDPNIDADILSQNMQISADNVGLLEQNAKLILENAQLTVMVTKLVHERDLARKEMIRFEQEKKKTMDLNSRALIDLDKLQEFIETDFYDEALNEFVDTLISSGAVYSAFHNTDIFQKAFLKFLNGRTEEWTHLNL